MSRHGQRVKPVAKFVCTHCRAQQCGNCTDITRVVAGLGEICACDLPNHSGEPSLQQVADPFDGSVHGPHGSVSEDGEVYVEPEWKRAFREVFGDRGSGD